VVVVVVVVIGEEMLVIGSSPVFPWVVMIALLMHASIILYHLSASTLTHSTLYSKL